MASQPRPVWVGQLERFGVESLVKLVLAVFALLIFALLASFLPGIDRLGALLPVPITAVITAVVTLAILALLFKIASQAKSLLRRIETPATVVRDTIAGVVYWGVLLIGVVIAYEGFSGVGQPLFVHAGFGVFYPVFFVLMAIVMVTLFLIEVGVFVQARQKRAREFRVAHDDIQPDTDRVHQILEEHGGRAYQRGFSRLTGWSDAKVSRVLSEMERNGLVTRYQVGREKIVCLPEHVPEFVSGDDSEPKTDPGQE